MVNDKLLAAMVASCDDRQLEALAPLSASMPSDVASRFAARLRDSGRDVELWRQVIAAVPPVDALDWLNRFGTSDDAALLPAGVPFQMAPKFLEVAHGWDGAEWVWDEILGAQDGLADLAGLIRVFADMDRTGGEHDFGVAPARLWSRLAGMVVADPEMILAVLGCASDLDAAGVFAHLVGPLSTLDEQVTLELIDRVAATNRVPALCDVGAAPELVAGASAHAATPVRAAVLAMMDPSRAATPLDGVGSTLMELAEVLDLAVGPFESGDATVAGLLERCATSMRPQFHDVVDVLRDAGTAVTAVQRCLVTCLAAYELAQNPQVDAGALAVEVEELDVGDLSAWVEAGFLRRGVEDPETVAELLTELTSRPSHGRGLRRARLDRFAERCDGGRAALCAAYVDAADAPEFALRHLATLGVLDDEAIGELSSATVFDLSRMPGGAAERLLGSWLADHLDASMLELAGQLAGGLKMVEIVELCSAARAT